MTLRFTPDPLSIVDPALKEWADERTKELIDAVNLYGGYRHAARVMKLGHGAIIRRVETVARRAALAGYSPRHGMTENLPEPFILKGRSVLRKLDPVTGQRVEVLSWDKTTVDDEKLRELRQAAYDAMAETLPRLEATPGPDQAADHLCNLYTLTDSHVGMLAWRLEGGADWDLKIAEQTLTGCFEQMVLSSPAATSCVVNQLGDWMHSDSLAPVTPTSGHIVDQDGRFSKMVAVAIRVLRRVIDLALTRHQKVYVVMAEGNHDMASSVWLRLMFAAIYENEPRLQVIDSELPYYVHQHGQTMLAFHHGHLKKNDQLPLLFASQYPVMWGATTKRYAHCGHRHHEEIKEHSGMKVIQHSTLAARDAYAARGGWMSERQCTAYTYHAMHGQVGSVTISPEMLEMAA